MVKRATKLTSENFVQAATGGKSYLPSSMRRELKAGGFFLGQKRLTQHQALKALRHLKSKNMLPKYSQPGPLWRHAAKVQYDQDAAARQAELAKHVQRDITFELEEEMADEVAGVLRYDPRSTLGKRVLEDLDRERQKREGAVAHERAKREKLIKAGTIKPKRRPVVDRPDLPDLEIG